jgi:hypothetical protein
MASETGPGREAQDGFYRSLPRLTAFGHAVSEGGFRSLPDDWVVGLADVVSSTAAVEGGRYKAVNLAGAAIISACSNVFGTLDFPFVFTGDGMACAVPAHDEALLRKTLAQTTAWIDAALSLQMRAAVVSVASIRAAGVDVRVARFAPSEHVAYAMFSGGGLAWAEAALKAGSLPTLPPDTGRPDLAGLTCRFRPIPSRRGEVLSLIVASARSPRDPRFQAVLDDLIAATADLNPVPAGGPAWTWPPAGLGDEARLHRRPGLPLTLSRLSVAGRTLMAAAVVKLGLRAGAFRPARYRGQIADNSDFRKFGDGLMMTVDCTPALSEAIKTRLAAAAADGVLDYGLHGQDAALMTCVVPAPSEAGHVHFIDGAGGGYTVAAERLKRARAMRLRAEARHATHPDMVAGGASRDVPC